MVLLVVDMLEDFFRMHATLAARRARLTTSLNELVRTFRRQDQPVIWVTQQFAPDLSDAFIEMKEHNLRVTIAGTEGCQLLAELEYEPADRSIIKKRYSAFFGTDLDEVLAGFRPRALVVSGINTHACVRTTVIDAYQRDYEVVVASDCIASYDDEHDGITRRYLDGAIARLLPNEAIVRLLAEHAV